jgi:hypothetical protein
MIADRETNLLSFRSVSSMLISGKPCFSDHLIPSVSSAVRFCLSDGGDVDSRRLQRLPIINLSKIFTGMHAVLRSGAIRADHRTSWSVLSAFIHSHVRVFRSPDVRITRSLKPRGAKPGSQTSLLLAWWVEIRRASTCHPERAAALAANEGPKSAKPSFPTPPYSSHPIPDWRDFNASRFLCVLCVLCGESAYRPSLCELLQRPWLTGHFRLDLRPKTRLVGFSPFRSVHPVHVRRRLPENRVRIL